MRGYSVLRKGGWDTHGLPVELEVERKLGFSGKRAIEDYGIAAFNQRCRESVFEYVEEWERMTERIGYWVDLPHAYITLTQDYVESLWWIFKQLWDRGLIYRGHKVVPYCPRCGTPLSSHELALGYQEGTKDPSIFVKFPVKDQSGSYFLVWTTTPWTLPGNVALAVGEDIDYVLVEHEGDKLWLAEARLPAVAHEKAGGYPILRRAKGRDLLGWHYKPLYTFMPVEQDYCYVIPGDFVSTEDGTGIVHIAPAYGADDLAAGQRFSLLFGYDAAERVHCPLNEKGFAEFLRAALAGVELTPKVRATLFRCYESTLIASVPLLLEEVNAPLVQAGVLRTCNRCGLRAVRWNRRRTDRRRRLRGHPRPSEHPACRGAWMPRQATENTAACPICPSAPRKTPCLPKFAITCIRGARKRTAAVSVRRIREPRPEPPIMITAAP
jgi:hypothetical protein